MKKVFILLSILIMCSGCCIKEVTIIDYIPAKEDNIHFPLESVFFLSALEWTGSGVLIEPNLIVTAGHVIEDVNWIDIRIDDNESNYISSDNLIECNVDLGLIVLDKDLEFTPIPLGDSNDLKLGDIVYNIGYPYSANTDIVTKGIVCGINVWEGGYFGNINMLIVDASTHPGNSGGAIINDKGELIGILVGSRHGSDNYSICIPINIFKQLYVDYLKGTENEECIDCVVNN